jgi:dTDP-4-amino-4,6-dideoxygalactose transaminase
MNSMEKLAIDGGKPVRDEFLIFGQPCLGEEEIAEVVETLRSGWIGTGPRAQQFEKEFAEYVGAQHAISLNSCTAGLFLSLVALDIGPGDEVITTPLTFAATANVIEHVGARPVFVDIDPLTLNLDPRQIKAAVTERTRAIIPVHFGGLPCDMETLLEIADSASLQLIEDAAHAVGARHEGKMVGSIGGLSAFSFYANKNLTTAEGGMLTTDDADLEARIRLLHLHGLERDAWKRFRTRSRMSSDIVLPGYKFNMTDIAAAIGIHQLRKQERFLEIRESHARCYDEAFADLPVSRQPRPRDLDTNRHGLHLYTLVLTPGRWRAHRNDVISALLAENIGAAAHYRTIHTQSYYRKKYGFQPNDYRNAYRISEHILSLPLTPGMSAGDVQDVIEGVHKVARAYAG